MPVFRVRIPVRQDELDEQLGYITQTDNQLTAVGSTIALTGETNGTAVFLLSGDVITNIHVYVTTQGATITFAKVGLYDESGNRLAVSADLTSAWETTGFKTHALTTPYTVTASGLYYVVALSVSGVTMPTFARHQAAVTATAPASAPFPYVKEVTQTDLDATATYTAGVRGYWFALT